MGRRVFQIPKIEVTRVFFTYEKYAKQKKQGIQKMEKENENTKINNCNKGKQHHTRERWECNTTPHNERARPRRGEERAAPPKKGKQHHTKERWECNTTESSSRNRSRKALPDGRWAMKMGKMQKYARRKRDVV